jgi:hypothetical protein
MFIKWNDCKAYQLKGHAAEGAKKKKRKKKKKASSPSAAQQGGQASQSNETQADSTPKR